MPEAVFKQRKRSGSGKRKGFAYHGPDAGKPASGGYRYVGPEGLGKPKGKGGLKTHGALKA